MSTDKIKIITDTASDIDICDAEKNDVALVPLSIIVNDKTYREQYDMSKQEYWDVLENSEKIPSTSQVTPQAFLDEYEKAYKNGYNKFIVVTINGTASGTFNSANLAAGMFNEKYTEAVEFKFIDSKLYSALYGKPILDAAKLIKDGKSYEEVYEFLDNRIAHMRAYAYMSTLKFAKMSGRISILSAIVGEALGLKPVMKIYDRKVEVMSKTRGEKAAISKMMQLIKEDADNLENEEIIIVHGNNDPESIDKVEEAIRKELNPKSVYRCALGCCITTNTGPQTIGVLYYGR